MRERRRKPATKDHDPFIFTPMRLYTCLQRKFFTGAGPGYGTILNVLPFQDLRITMSTMLQKERLLISRMRHSLVSSSATAPDHKLGKNRTFLCCQVKASPPLHLPPEIVTLGKGSGKVPRLGDTSRLNSACPRNELAGCVEDVMISRAIVQVASHTVDFVKIPPPNPAGRRHWANMGILKVCVPLFAMLGTR